MAMMGLLVVDKPLGWSSAHVVRRVKRAAGGVKTGHAGTLDPLATGVVVCCLGKATKSAEQLMGMTKVYEAEVDLTAFTTTDDMEGEREEIEVAQPPDVAALQSVLEQFVGNIEQTPPAFSAVHVNGQRAYKLARQGKTVELKKRIVRVDSIELLSYQWPVATLRITCGKGTYIRSIARDLGGKLNTGGHLLSLRRTAVGPYDIAKSVDEERLDSPIMQDDLLPIPK